jgi:hypothetical protein
MKNCINSKPEMQFFYSVENEYSSNDPNVSDIQRYFIKQELVPGVENHTFISMDGGPDEIEFENNYKSYGIQID